MLTGDTILGRGTTVIAHPDGALGPYLGLAAPAGRAAGRAPRCCPGTARSCRTRPRWPPQYLAHREQRLDQVRAALTELGPDATARQVVELVYADVDRALWPAAEWSVRAQLDYLRS